MEGIYNKLSSPDINFRSAVTELSEQVPDQSIEFTPDLGILMSSNMFVHQDHSAMTKLASDFETYYTSPPQGDLRGDVIILKLEIEVGSSITVDQIRQVCSFANCFYVQGDTWKFYQSLFF